MGISHYEGPTPYTWKSRITKIDTVFDDTAKYIYYNNSVTPSYKIKLFDSSTVYKTNWHGGWVPYIKFSAPLKSYWPLSEINPHYCYLDTMVQANFFGYNTTGLRFYTFRYEPKYNTYAPVTKFFFLKGIGFYHEEFDIGFEVLHGCIINGVQYGYPVAIEKDNYKIITKNRVVNFPNPFNSQARIVYELSSGSNISVKVYDVVGREVDIIEEGYKEAGSYTKFWNPKNIASGTYFIVFRSPNSLVTRKMIYLK